MTQRPTVPGETSARQQTIAGLRGLADFLVANPDVPVSEFGVQYTIYIDEPTDETARAELNRLAALLEGKVQDDTTRGGHVHATRNFGSVAYRVVYIPARAWAEHNARNSHERNIILDPTSETGEAA